MAVTAKCIYEAAQLPAAATTIATAAANTRLIIDKLSVINTSAATVTVTVNVVQSGGSVATTNALINAYSLVQNGTYGCPEIVGHVLNPGDFVSVTASAATAVNARLSAREVTV